MQIYVYASESVSFFPQMVAHYTHSSAVKSEISKDFWCSPQSQLSKGTQ